MRIRRYLIEVDFINPRLPANRPGNHTIEDRARDAAPPYTTVRFRDLRGEVAALVRKVHKMGEAEDRLRQKYEKAQGWNKIVCDWQLRLMVPRTPTHLQVAHCAAEELEAAIAAKQSVAIQTVHFGWHILPPEGLAAVVAMARRATCARIVVYPPQSLLAKTPPMLLYTR